MPDATTPTLYEWAGGREAFERLINAFYDRVEGDELLAPLFGGRVTAEHRDHVIAWWSRGVRRPGRATPTSSAATSTCSRSTAASGITAEQRFRFASLMSLAADDAGLPGDPDFRSAFVAYVEWGTRLAMHNSQPDAEVFEHAPVPRWGWGEAPPFTG